MDRGPCSPHPCPRPSAAIASHLGGSGSSRPDAWARSTLLPGPGRFGYPCDREAPSRGDGGGGRIMLGRAEGLARRLPRPIFPPQACPTHLHGPSLTSRGWEAARSPQRPSMSGPQARPQEEAALGRRMATRQPVDQRGGGLRGGWEAWTSCRGGSSLPGPGAGTGLADAPWGAGASGLAWPPGLQSRAQEVGVERASHGAGTGSAGS